MMSNAEKLRNKIEEWTTRFESTDAHSISNQIATMLSRSAFYRSINESRKYLPDCENQRKRANGLLHEMIDDGYFHMASVSIRRILDQGALSGPRGVISLFGLVKDIAANSNLLTRENVLKARNLVYDFEPIKQRAMEEAWADQREKKSSATFVSMNGWSGSKTWHNLMDKLCGVMPMARQPTDTPEASRFQKMIGDLNTCAESVKNWTDKFVAHASTLESRATLSPEDHTMSLAKLWTTERAVVRCAEFVSMYIVQGRNLGGVPICQFDQFESLNEPFVTDAARTPMEKAWQTHSNEIRACSDWFWDQPLTDASDNWPE